MELLQGLRRTALQRSLGSRSRHHVSQLAVEMDKTNGWHKSSSFVKWISYSYYRGWDLDYRLGSRSRHHVSQPQTSVIAFSTARWDPDYRLGTLRSRLPAAVNVGLRGNPDDISQLAFFGIGSTKLENTYLYLENNNNNNHNNNSTTNIVNDYPADHHHHHHHHHHHPQHHHQHHQHEKVEMACSSWCDPPGQGLRKRQVALPRGWLWIRLSRRRLGSFGIRRRVEAEEEEEKEKTSGTLQRQPSGDSRQVGLVVGGVGTCERERKVDKVLLAALPRGCVSDNNELDKVSEAAAAAAAAAALPRGCRSDRNLDPDADADEAASADWGGAHGGGAPRNLLFLSVGTPTDNVSGLLLDRRRRLMTSTGSESRRTPLDRDEVHQRGGLLLMSTSCQVMATLGGATRGACHQTSSSSSSSSSSPSSSSSSSTSALALWWWRRNRSLTRGMHFESVRLGIDEQGEGEFGEQGDLRRGVAGGGVGIGVGDEGMQSELKQEEEEEGVICTRSRPTGDEPSAGDKRDAVPIGGRSKRTDGRDGIPAAGYVADGGDGRQRLIRRRRKGPRQERERAEEEEEREEREEREKVPFLTAILVGRPNVGKSALYNRLVRRREALTQVQIQMQSDAKGEIGVQRRPGSWRHTVRWVPVSGEGPLITTALNYDGGEVVRLKVCIEGGREEEMQGDQRLQAAISEACDRAERRCRRDGVTVGLRVTVIYHETESSTGTKTREEQHNERDSGGESKMSEADRETDLRSWNRPEEIQKHHRAAEPVEKGPEASSRQPTPRGRGTGGKPSKDVVAATKAQQEAAEAERQRLANEAATHAQQTAEADAAARDKRNAASTDGKSIAPSEAERARIAALLREKKEKREILKQAKLKAIEEEQAAKKKRLEEEMLRFQKEKMMLLEREEEERRKVAEEEATREEEEEGKEEPLERKRGGERGEASGTKEEDRWREKKISEWVANLSLGEDEEAQQYVPQEEREVFARALELIEDPLERQATEDEKKLEWKLKMMREKKRRREEASRIAGEVERVRTGRQELQAKTEVSAKLDKMMGFLEILSEAWMEEHQARKGQEVTLQAMRSGFREFASDVVGHVGSEIRRLRDGVDKLCAGAIETAKVVATTEATARPRKEPVKLKFPDPYSGKEDNFDNWEASINTYVFLQHIAPEEQVLVAFHALKGEAASFGRSLARAADCEHNMIAYSRLTPLTTFLKLLRKRFADITRGVKASDKLQTIHSRQRRSARALKAVMDDLVAVLDHGVTETQLVQLFYCAMPEPLRGHFFDKTQQPNITYDALSREVVLFEAKSMPVSTFWHKDLDKGKKWKGRTISGQGIAKLGDLQFKVIDTAGMELTATQSNLLARATALTQSLLHRCDLALLLVDGRAGIQPLDMDLANWLRRQDVQTILVVNKCEGGSGKDGAITAVVAEAHVLGMGEPVAVSAEAGEGMVDLYSRMQPLVDSFGKSEEEDVDQEEGGGEAEDVQFQGLAETSECEAKNEQETLDGAETEEKSPANIPLQFAIAGRPNVGKSTLVNALLGEERVLTGAEPGLTRDSVRIRFEYQGRPVWLVDTAGWMHRTLLQVGPTSLSAMDARRNLMRAHVVALMVDGVEALAARATMKHSEIALARWVTEEGRALVISGCR
ncbi:hypothetical protein CBR_g2956 [Chara braunii]|uniref:G domain-containing protein n=1 Tax=Chara braunii TaxID=69332 RepID=A0A388KEC5_CHABU|nr:hypothetical protein CBR_g2956 [Chara braunii]|eukprot:GBG68412.1 hypothetical protein CBR_g2956 [Chara braunii]